LASGACVIVVAGPWRRGLAGAFATWALTGAATADVDDGTVPEVVVEVPVADVLAVDGPTVADAVTGDAVAAGDAAPSSNAPEAPAASTAAAPISTPVPMAPAIIAGRRPRNHLDPVIICSLGVFGSRDGD
jgi:hypothetical protein